MSLAEIKKQIDRLDAEQRNELSAYLLFLRRREDPEWLEELERRNRAMDAGKKVSQEELQRIHEALVREGR